MNYRHHFHAGNYADVFKHVLLRQLLAGMLRKEKGLLYLDTHAGRGSYDLEGATRLPDGRERAPEWPDGIGRLWTGGALPPVVADFVEAVRAWNLRCGAAPGELSHYPGSPWVAQALLRPQDRAALCELREDDAEALDLVIGGRPGVSVHTLDGYIALRAMLPPPERRALVLIDPSFESATEFADIRAGLREALRRFPSGVYAVWYPVTERARSDEFLRDLRESAPAEQPLPPALVAELQIAADSSPVRMKGCGLLVLNPPWQIEAEFRAVLPVLASRMGLDAGAAGRVFWLVPER
ncbi:MAG: 23S rRNA (adenine(2030)-N(6))-methyltransferase RlmJ [Opitutales bacterium]